MIREYLRYLLAHPHDAEYGFFKNFRHRQGTAVVVGFNQGRSLSTFRIYNQTYRLIVFERNLFLKSRLEAMRWLAGKDFAYYLVRLGRQQHYQAMFVPRVHNRRLVRLATTNRADLAPEPEAPEAPASLPAPETDTEETTTSLAQLETATSGIDEIAVETKVFDDFRLNPDAVIISPDHFEQPVLEGMSGTIHRCKPLFMLPAVWPVIEEANHFLAEREYRPYCYNARKNTLRPFEKNKKSTHLFFVHRAAFETDKEVRM